MIDPLNVAAPVKEVADLNGFDHGLLCDEQIDIIQKNKTKIIYFDPHKLQITDHI